MSHTNLRDYQRKTIDMLYQWFENGNQGNPCLVLPTGAGKSHIIAAMCKEALQEWPETRILMLTHVKELIEQNSEKLRQHWPNAPMGIYSASLGKRCLSEPITFAGIQSVRTKSQSIGHVDLIIIDECHLVSNKDEGGYRTLIKELAAINPAIRVIGLTASPYRLGHGMITDKPAIFDALIEPVSIEELVYKGFLSVLRSKVTSSQLDVSGVHKRGGEFIESELQQAVNTVDQNDAVVSEVIARAGDRRAWLFFCSGVAHAEAIAATLQARGIVAACVTGDTPKAQREAILRDYKDGKIRALTNALVLTTGFDYPGIDLIAMLRPTMSPGLFYQMAGRGLRVKPHTDHCLVLDFAGLIETHGPITALRTPEKKGEEGGEAPVKVCENCGEVCHAAVKLCPDCGTPFPEPEKKKLSLHDDDIMGIESKEMDVTGWLWRVHTSKASGKPMLCVIYYGALSDKPVTEYLAVSHEGYAGQKAMREFRAMAESAGCAAREMKYLDDMANAMNVSKPPAIIAYKMEGKYARVTEKRWTQ